MFNDVKEFAKKFGHLAHDKPVHLTKRKLRERIDFLQEELDEFKKAVEDQDLEEQADALVDLVYVALGTAVMLGLPWYDLWDDVHRANMAKRRGVGPRGHLVDCIKPVGWEPPKTLEILRASGYQRYSFIAEVDDPEHLVTYECSRCSRTYEGPNLLAMVTCEYCGEPVKRENIKHG